MKVLIDTSAFMAMASTRDQDHGAATVAWEEFLEANTSLVTHNYVLVETMALLQNRAGLAPVRLLLGQILPAVDCIWVDSVVHEGALEKLLA